MGAPATNPLLLWPQPETDRPDAFFRRQFSDSGQCFHYMGTLTDALTDPIPGTSVPRGLATSAVVRCNDLVEDLLRQVVVDGGPGTRRSGFGLYELMHVVEDSFSGAHAQRAPGGIAYVRVWKPIERFAGLSSEDEERIPEDVFHTWDDHRDKTYVIEGGAEDCESRVDHPYDVPFSCLSAEGDLDRQALVELLVVVRDLRVAQLAAPPGTDTHPEASPAWKRYRASWLAAVHPCEGAECDVRQPAESAPGRYAFLGVDTRFTTPGTFDVGVRGTSLRYAEGLNPFVYAVSASLGYEYQEATGNNGYVGLGFSLLLPLGRKAFIGLTPAELRIVYGASGGSLEMLTRLLRFDYAVSRDVALSIEAPLSVNWVVPRADWSVGVGVSYGLTSPRLVGGHGLVRHDEPAERQDDGWVPPPAPYGRLEGRRATFVAFAGATAVTTPDPAARGAHLRGRGARRRDGLGSRPLGRPLRLHPGRLAGRWPAQHLRCVLLPHRDPRPRGALDLPRAARTLGHRGPRRGGIQGPREGRGGHERRRPGLPGERVLPPGRLPRRPGAPARNRRPPGGMPDDRLGRGALRCG